MAHRTAALRNDGAIKSEFAPVIEDEPAGKRKPKCKRLPNAVLDDRRLCLADTFFLVWRARHAAKWTSRAAQLDEEHGFGPDLFHPSMNRLKAFGYIERRQERARKNGRFEFATEKLNLSAAPASKRTGYTLLETDIAGMPWRQAALLDYLRSHAEDFIQNAKDIGKRFALTDRTVRDIVKPLEEAGLVELRIVRDERGRIKQKGYAATKAVAQFGAEIRGAPCGSSPNADFTMCGRIRAHNREQPYNSLRETTLNSAKAETATTSKQASTRVRSQDVQGKGKSTTAKQRKADREARAIKHLYKQTGLEEPFTLPATFEEAAKQIAVELERKANAGCDISDAPENCNHLVEVEFFDAVSETDLADTECLTDGELREGILRATANRVKPALIGEEGLASVRQMLARIMQDDVPAEEAFEALLSEIEKATAAKRRWLNGWNLIARRIAPELYTSGGDNMLMFDGEGFSLTEKFQNADENGNGVLHPSMFSAKGLSGLRALIERYGTEAVDEAVSEFIWRSKLDREIPAGYVRGWGYFVRYIEEQRNRDRERARAC